MNIKFLKAALLAGAVLLLVLNAGYAMQPPPPPLNLTKFKDLISLADIIAVGKIGAVRQTDKLVNGEMRRTVEADLSIEKLLKGKVPAKNLTIQESYPVLNPPAPGAASKGGNESKGMIVGMKAGPSAYHGQYSTGMRIVVLLEKAPGTQGYRPLGSGSYDKYLCEFLLEKDGIKTLYFRFAEDMSHYAKSEDHFVQLINRLCNPGS